MGSRGIRPAYSSYISPEDIVVRDKLTRYNDQLLALLMWESSTSSNAATMVEITQENLQIIYDSMGTEDQAEADVNRKKLLRGERGVDGAITDAE